ncbi:MAG: hypothetical protein ACJLS2_02420 [Microcella pacifica]
MHMRVAPMSDTGQELYTPSDDEVMTDYLNMQSLIGDESDIDANYQAVLRWGRWLAAHDAEVARAAAEKAWDDFLAYKYLPPAVREYVEAYRLEQNDE